MLGLIGVVLFLIDFGRKSPSGPAEKEGLIPVVENKPIVGENALARQLRQKLEVYRMQVPGMPAVPTSPVKWGGWIEEWKTRAQQRSQTRTIQEQLHSDLEIDRLVTAIHEELLRYVTISNAIEEAIRKAEEAVQDAKFIKSRRPKRRRQQDELEDERHKAEIEKARAETAKAIQERIRAEADTKAITHPPPAPPVPHRDTPEEQRQKIFAAFARLYADEARDIAACDGDARCIENVKMRYEHEQMELKQKML